MKLLIFILSINLLFSRNVAVLLGGIGCNDGRYMAGIGNMLRARGFTVIDNIQVDTSMPICEQSKDIMKTLGSIHKLNSKDNLVLVGHSQGGLRAFELFKSLEGMKDYGFTPVNSTAVFTISTPWSGASIISDTDEILLSLDGIVYNFDKLRDYQSEIAKFINIREDLLKSYIDFARQSRDFLRASKNCLGVKDMVVKGEHLKGVNRAVSNVHIFNITGYVDDFFSTFGLSEYILESSLTKIDLELEIRRKEAIENGRVFGSSAGSQRGTDIGGTVGAAGGTVAGLVVGGIAAAFLGPVGLIFAPAIFAGATGTGALAGQGIGYVAGSSYGEKEALSRFEEYSKHARDLKMHLKSLLDIVKKLNIEQSDLVLTLENQKLPSLLNEAQVKLRDNSSNGSKTLEFRRKGIHITINTLTNLFPQIANQAIYDNQEVINYISNSLNDDGTPIIKNEDIR